MKNMEQSLLLVLKIIMFFLYNPRLCRMSEFSIIPPTPFGEYKIIFDKILTCNSSKEYKLQFNYYVVRTANSSELKGNMTFLIPFDDSFFFEINMATRDSSGRWKDNTRVQKAPKACTVMKMGLGNSFNKYMKGFGIDNDACPIPPGAYVGDGVDSLIFMDTNFPRVFFYGSYKLRLSFSRKNEIFGCSIIFFDLRRR